MSKDFEIRGADGQTIGIETGEYYFNTKARIRRRMLNSLSSEVRQIDACIELATMGWQQEGAVIRDSRRSRPRPLSPDDIVQMTGLSKQHVRRGLRDWQEAGLGEVRSDDNGPLRKGHIRIYSWAVPRKAGSKNGSRARLLFPDWFPESWEPFKPLIKRLKLSVSIDYVAARGYFEEGDRVARDYQKAEKEVARFLERICARQKKPRINKEERTEITERTVSEWQPTPPDTAPFTEPSPPPTPLTQNPSQEVNERPNSSPVVACVEQAYHKLAAKDPLRGKFASLPIKLGIPVFSTCRLVKEKIDEGRAWHAQALYNFVMNDARGWIRSHRREIEADANGERNRNYENGNSRNDVPFANDEIRSHLQACARAVRQHAGAAFEEIAAVLESLAEGECLLEGLDALEQRLSELEEKVAAKLEECISLDDRSAIQEGLKSELKEYRSRMTAKQLALLERRYLANQLFERSGLPRLSLFYLDSSTTQKAGQA